MKAKNVNDSVAESGAGVLFLIVGILLIPVLIGIPIAAFGLYMMGQSLISEKEKPEVKISPQVNKLINKYIAGRYY